MIEIWLAARSAGVGLWRVVKSPIGRVIALLVVAAIAVTLFGNFRFDQGVAKERVAEAARLAEASRKAAKVSLASASISAQVQRDLGAALDRNAALTRQLQQKATTYVTSEADRRCVIPAGYVRLRDAAGAGVDPLPAATGGPVNANSGLVLSDLAANDLVNAAAFHSAVAEVTAWRGWYAAQADLWSKTTKAPDTAP